jgi:tetratricopeptide (TPR) repeat protein
LGLAVTEHNFGNYDKATDFYTAAINLNPVFAQSYALIALLHYSRNELEYALTCAKKCLKHNGKNIFGQYIFVLSFDQTTLE